MRLVEGVVVDVDILGFFSSTISGLVYVEEVLSIGVEEVAELISMSSPLPQGFLDGLQ